MKETNFFICQTCHDDKEYTPKEILAHLQEAHHVDTGKPAKREAIMFADGDDFFANTYVWHFGKVELLQRVMGKRLEDGL